MRAYYQAQPFGDVSGSRFTWSHQAMFGADGQTYTYSHQANFGEIVFAVAGQADCKAKMDAIEAAFYVPYGDLLILNDDGSNSTNCIASSGTLNGVKPGRLTWGDAAGAQFTTWRQLSCDFSWETRAPGLSLTFLTEFSETVRVQGGTPLTGVREPINIPVSAVDEFILVPMQKYVVTQQGRAVGLFSLPTAPAPLYPNPNTNPLSNTTPSRIGPGTYEKYAVEWSYSWEFGALPFLPIANLWPV